MTVDLSQYLNQEVEVTYENGNTATGKVVENPYMDSSGEIPYFFRSSQLGSAYNKEGFFGSHRSFNSLNIVKIKPINMKKYEQLENQIKELQAEVERLKKEEESTKLPRGFSRVNAIEFLKTFKRTNLSGAFTWFYTPQGEDYWKNISDSLVIAPSYKVPEEAIIAIQSWVIESYKEQYGV